jgi:hypothetical protein
MSSTVEVVLGTRSRTTTMERVELLLWYLAKSRRNKVKGYDLGRGGVGEINTWR